LPMRPRGLDCSGGIRTHDLPPHLAGTLSTAPLNVSSSQPDPHRLRAGESAVAEGGRVELPVPLARHVRFRGGWAHHVPSPSIRLG